MQFEKILKSRFHFYTSWHILLSVGDNAATVSEFHFNVDRYSVYIEIYYLHFVSANLPPSRTTPNGANRMKRLQMERINILPTPISVHCLLE